MNNMVTLGPMLFNWPLQKKMDFYNKIADEANLDTVYIGEVVCQKRFACWGNIYDKIVERLTNAGKQVIISSLALINTDEELKIIKDYSTKSDLLIEANDISVVNLLNDNNYCLGPYINIYNEMALDFYAKNGAKHITFSPELPNGSIEVLAKQKVMDMEIQVFGRMPLAISARCAHARIYKQKKTNCKYVCEKDLDGLDVHTLDKQPFLTINGLQTMSYAYCNMLNEIQYLQDLGVNRFRVSPQNVDMIAVIDIYRQVVEHNISSEEGQSKLSKLLGNTEFSNGFFYGTAGHELVRQSIPEQQE